MIGSSVVAIARDGCDSDFAILRELGTADLKAVDAIRASVLSSLADADQYVPHAHEAAFVRSHLGPAGFSVGIEIESRMVGYSALSLEVERAELDPEFERAIARWCDARRRPIRECCVLAVSMIVPGYTGLGLHRAAIEFRLRCAWALGRKVAFAMTSPVNRSALANLWRSGMRIEDSIRFADGRVRHFMVGSTATAASPDA
jgi:hypothetical protein